MMTLNVVMQKSLSFFLETWFQSTIK